MSYLKDREILQRFDDSYQEGFDCWNPLFPEAELDLKFFLGDQWSSQEKSSLSREGRNSFVFNRVRPVISLITGYQRQHRLSSVVVPVEGSDQVTADQLSMVMYHVMSLNNGYQIISDCFGGAVKTGWNMASIWIDYRDDPVNGDIRFNREPWNSFIIDPYFSKLDFSDCSYILRRKYISLDMAISLLPNSSRDIRLLQKTGNSRDAKFSWLPYQRSSNGGDLLAYNEDYRVGWENKKVLVDIETGVVEDWSSTDDIFEKLQQINPSFRLISTKKRFVERNIIINDHVVATDKNPDGINDYPFVMFVCTFEPECDDFALKIQSLVRPMRDPQREANRRRSQMIDILDSQINSGWIATEGSVVNPQSLFQASQGKVIWRNQDAPPDSLIKIQPAQIPPSSFQLQQQMDADMKEVAGVNDAAFGIMESGNESGIMTMLRQGAALTNLQDVFDNLRFSQKRLSQLTLLFIQQWSPEKIKRIINEDPSPEFYDKDFTKYDCAVQEGILTETQRQAFFRQLIDLKQLGEPIPPMLLAKAAPIQGKSEYYKEMDQFNQQQAKMHQEQMQVQQQLLKTQADLATSQSLFQVAGAKERNTRSIANMGLDSERDSQAVQNRAQAVLQQAQTLRELDQMDLMNMKEELTLAQMLKDQARNEEQQLNTREVVEAQQESAQPLQQETENGSGTR